jgi:secreted PhoX family phosphatase
MAETSPPIGDVIVARFGRRELMKRLLAATAMAAITPLGRRAEAEGFGFIAVEHGIDETHHVAPGYDADVLIRWGDPVLPGAPAFDPMNQTGAAQSRQFGFNNDFLGYVPLGPDRALLCVNHEFTTPEMMFPNLPPQPRVRFRDMTREQVAVEMMAHGASIIEIRKSDGKWSIVRDSRYARRITAETPMRLSGPAAGHGRMRTSYDPAGAAVRGMIANCAGGITPWGSYLACEENFHFYFRGTVSGAEERNHKTYGVPDPLYAWSYFHDRFDIDKEPHEPNRFGWVVEIDPRDPASTPIKRTALGRFKHEGAESVVNKDGRVVVYSGDDERFCPIYRFVTAGRFDPGNPAANRDLLDAGTLSAARFHPDGTMEWLDLVHGQGPLTEANGFAGQADVLIEARRAALLLGATPMDRPEGITPSKARPKVYAALTNNERRKADQVDAANPRGPNPGGHVIEWTVPDGDHAAPRCRWEIFAFGGGPANFGCPDNLAIDDQGRLWIASDQGPGWKTITNSADGVFAVETEGPLRSAPKLFYRVPVGAELCGPCFAPDYRTFFCAVQHPGLDGAQSYAPFGRRSTFDDPATRWPDFKPGMPPRPSVVAITKRNGGIIGS